jgi:hypothetical protein
MKKILLVNHKEQKCGVYQYGYNTAQLLKFATKFEFVYVECANMAQLRWQIASNAPIAVVYNYHVSTLGWVRQPLLDEYKNIKHLMIHHEPHQPLPARVDAIISQDPTEPESGIKFSVPRILQTYLGPLPVNELPVVGSFGFGMAGKGFDTLVERVSEEFEQAQIRLHIPYAHFGDQSGQYARDWAQRARDRCTKEGIKLAVDHKWYTTHELLEFLASNDINVFMYDNMARGVASVLDFALSVSRPIAITTSLMFKHVWQQVPEVTVEENSLVDILERGIEPLRPLYEQWSADNFRREYERIISTVCQE